MADQMGSLLVIKTVSLLAAQKVSQMEIMPLVITTLLCLVDQKVLPMGMR